MAMKMSSSQHEMVQRPVMSASLFKAAMKGNKDVLIQCLGLLKEQKEVKVIIEASDSAPEQINTENQTVQSELQSATRFGDTLLHLLVTKGHNELALMVFQRDMSLLKAQNNILETPLYCAAKVGNEKVIHNLIQIDHVIVKDALAVTNKNGDTAMHVATKHDHRDIGRMLMNLDPEIAFKVNDKMESPLYMAIIEGRTIMVVKMLEVDPTLACTPFSDGMFPIHEAARMGNDDLIEHFIKKYPSDAELQDPRGRNLFHIAAEENQQIFSGVFKDASFREMIERMITATNYEGDTPLVIAAMKGNKTIMRAIWKHYQVAEIVPNMNGYTPFELSVKQVVKTNETYAMWSLISDYKMTYGEKFSEEWFSDVMKQTASLENKWERTQVIGLGSVLITTVTFAAAFTIPGGYNQDDGTPVLRRRYMFWAFILANALTFIEGFISLFALLVNALPDVPVDTFLFATVFFLLAATTMVVTFGLGLYVTLAPVCLPIAIILLVIILFIMSPALLISLLRRGEKYIRIISKFVYHWRTIVAIYAMSLLFIFCVALLSL